MLNELHIDLDSPNAIPKMQDLLGPRYADYARETEQAGFDLWRQMEAARMSPVEKVSYLVGTAQLISDRWNNKQMPYACKPGCAYCCHLQVEIGLWEATALVSWVEDHFGELGLVLWLVALAYRAEQVTGMGATEYRRLNLRCPFLTEENRCGVHSIRPIACVGYHSVDAAACAKGMEEPSATIPFFGEAWMAPNILRVGALRAIRSAGGVDKPLELHAALIIALLLRLGLA